MQVGYNPLDCNVPETALLQGRKQSKGQAGKAGKVSGKVSLNGGAVK